MADRPVRAVGVTPARPGPIEAIARAELARSARLHEVPLEETGPDLVPPSGLNRPQGLSGVIDAALGPVDLPTLHELHGALAAMEDRLRASAGTSEMPELDEVVIAVLAEEQDKISRYMTVRDR